MPRKARIDAPGALHHIIVRGIERRRVFSDDQDRDNLIERLGDIVIETKTFCFAWALGASAQSCPYSIANRSNFSGYCHEAFANRLCGFV